MLYQKFLSNDFSDESMSDEDMMSSDLKKRSKPEKENVKLYFNKSLVWCKSVAILHAKEKRY